MVVGDLEVLSVSADAVLKLLIRRLFCSLCVRKLLPLSVDRNGYTGSCGRRRVNFGVIRANGLNNHIIRQIVLFAGIDGYGLGRELFFVRHITVENGLVALVMVK